MTHYFQTPSSPEIRHEVIAEIWGREYAFLSAAGVFSSSRLDPGPSVLFRLTDPPQDRTARFLDLGCGFGPIGIALAAMCPSAHVDAVDVNDRALSLTRDNAQRLGVAERISVMHPDEVPGGTTYDEIWSNPPIRIGKKGLHSLLTAWLGRLKPDGAAKLVVGKNLGADSLHSWLEAEGWAVTRLGSSKGFRVLSVGQATSVIR